MADDSKAKFIERLAHNNPVDLNGLCVIQIQLKELEDAGISQKTEYSIQRPLGRVCQSFGSGAIAEIIGREKR